MFPGLSMPNEQGEQRWYVPFFVIDFDQTRPLDLPPLIDTLEGYGLYTYSACGTTGGQPPVRFCRGVCATTRCTRGRKVYPEYSQGNGVRFTRNPALEHF